MSNYEEQERGADAWARKIYKANLRLMEKIRALGGTAVMYKDEVMFEVPAHLQEQAIEIMKSHWKEELP